MKLLMAFAVVIEMEVVILLALCILGFATTVFKEWK